ncbi:MAG: zinc-ribbon and DUF3426 domain-containing protein [Gammaproteobacteria bacterium]|nr:zinc-ribbon and DUF3426 domain-containing protein [Gammaproteobacteria bacterium]
MQIRCPECNTLFKLNKTDLTTQVQCGHCFHIFQATPEQETFKLVEEVNTADIDINTFTDAIDDIPKEEPLSSEPSTATPLFEQSPMVDDLVPPELRHQTAKSSSTLAKVAWSFGIFCLTIAASAQLVYFKRSELASNAELRPYLLSICELAKCDIPELKDISRLELSSKNVYSHPNVDNALMITAVIVNQAAFSQRFPTLQVSFTNLVGDIVMARQFNPGEYLNTNEDKLSEMQPGLPIQIILEVLDPGKNATAYEFSFI